MKRKLDIIFPVFNESETIEEFLKRLHHSFLNFEFLENWDIQLILVNDGSTDNSDQLGLSYAQKNKVSIRIVNLSKNFGHQYAISAGIRNSRDKSCLVVLDADLQDPPELIPEFLKRLNADSVIVTKRITRKDSLLKRLSAWFFYRILNFLSGNRIALDSGDYWAIGENPSEILRTQITEKNIFIRALIRDLGFDLTELYYNRDSRYAGTGKYSLGKMLKLASAGLTHYSSSPIRLTVLLGSIVFALSFFGLFFIVAGRVFGFIDFSPGLVIFSLVSVPLILVLMFVQIITILLVGKVLDEVRGRPGYIIKSSKELIFED